MVKANVLRSAATLLLTARASPPNETYRAPVDEVPAENCCTFRSYEFVAKTTARAVCASLVAASAATITATTAPILLNCFITSPWLDTRCRVDAPFVPAPPAIEGRRRGH